MRISVNVVNKLKWFSVFYTHIAEITVYNLALAYWPMASKYCSGPVIFLFTGPDWPVKNLDNI